MSTKKSRQSCLVPLEYTQGRKGVEVHFCMFSSYDRAGNKVLLVIKSLLGTHINNQPYLGCLPSQGKVGEFTLSLEKSGNLVTSQGISVKLGNLF